LKDIQSHPFFSSIDWALLEVKQVDPPFKPDSSSLLTYHQSIIFPDLESVLKGMSELMSE
jgi:hypothetical protein